MNIQENLSTIASFVKNHKNLVLVSSIALFCVVIFCILVGTLLGGTKENGVRPQIDFSELYLSDEPYFYPEIFQFRVPKTVWNEEDLENWFSPLSEEERDLLEETFSEETNRILEAVP